MIFLIFLKIYVISHNYRPKIFCSVTTASMENVEKFLAYNLIYVYFCL
jgi:hypothetical protein